MVGNWFKTEMSKVLVISACVILMTHLLLGYEQNNDVPRASSNMFHKNLKSLFSGKQMNKDIVSKDNICCADGQWEATIYIRVGSTMSFGPNASATFFYIGTGNVAFDDVRKKSYVNYSVKVYSPVLPGYQVLNSTVIKDFVAGVMYEIDEDGKCSKETNSEGMEIVCVPATGKLISEGIFGGINVSTYQFSSFDQLEKVTTASVLKNGSYCETVMMSYVLYSDEIPDVLFYDLNVVDLTKGIKDPSIFVVPASCNSS